MTDYYASHSRRTFDVMRDVYEGSLSSGAPTVDVPADTLKVTLRAHQQAVLHRMAEYESQALTGMDCSGERIFSTYGILGDSVGVGKSLMVLGHIARLSSLGTLQGRMRMGNGSQNTMFSIKTEPYSDISEAGCLIIVPHTLFRQWADYIKKQTSLKAVLLDKKKCIDAENFTRDMLAAEVVLVSNTLFKQFSVWGRDHGIRWKRIFVDEADTIHLVNGYPWPETRFTWFITASWMNMLFPNEHVYVGHQSLQTYVFSDNATHKCLRPFFEDLRNSHQAYHYLRHYLTSYGYFRGILNSAHRLRGHLVIRCSEDFIKESISLPVLHRQVILCRQPVNHQIVSDVVPAEVAHLLHGGDVQGAIAALGVKSEDATSLTDAVTENLKRELKRLQSTFQFKSGLDYSSAKAKEEALKSLEEKMKRTEDAIKSLEERIQAAATESCPICYDEGQDPVITPCCTRVFCAGCILTCLTKNATCPMCRAALAPKQLTRVVAQKDTNAIVPAKAAEPVDPLLKKPDALFKLFKENPTGRFLVFSRYDNPFNQMEEAIESIGVRVRQVKGNKDAVAATLRAFQGGDLRCLLLNAHNAGSGLNITAATHVVLLHAMTHEEEKQILGRAYRLGRTEPLRFIKLLHEGEVPTTN